VAAHVGFVNESSDILILEGPVLIGESTWWRIRYTNLQDETLEGWLQGDFLATATPGPSPTP
jgi:hypothetical protein